MTILGFKSSKTTDVDISDISSTELFKEVHFETYKQLKKAVKSQETDLTKTEIYEKLLQPFKHSIKKVPTSKEGKFKTIYVCEYEGCGKDYTKIWNLLDHVRMHEGIKPYECKI